MWIVGILIYFVMALITSVITYLSEDMEGDFEGSAIIGLLWFIVIPYLALKLFTEKIVRAIRQLS